MTDFWTAHPAVVGFTLAIDQVDPFWGKEEFHGKFECNREHGLPKFPTTKKCSRRYCKGTADIYGVLSSAIYKRQTKFFVEWRCNHGTHRCLHMNKISGTVKYINEATSNG